MVMGKGPDMCGESGDFPGAFNSRSLQAPKQQIENADDRTQNPENRQDRRDEPICYPNAETDKDDDGEGRGDASEVAGHQ